MENYIYIHKHIKNTYSLGDYELEELSVMIIAILIIYFFQDALKIGHMIGILWIGYILMQKLHEIKNTKVKNFKSHLAYKFGFIAPKTFPPSYLKEFLG
jgi:conjugal transfer pilus assembly protein TraL